MNRVVRGEHLRHLVDEAFHARLVEVVIVGVVHAKAKDSWPSQPLQALPERRLRTRRREVVFTDALGERRTPCGVEPREAGRGAVRLPEQAACLGDHEGFFGGC